jgi:prepilin-type N-terminal cleavage/methylation domain-containing protein
MKKRSFTLIELLIVVSIIMILASIAIEQFKKIAKQNNKLQKDNYSAYRGRR